MIELSINYGDIEGIKVDYFNFPGGEVGLNIDFIDEILSKHEIYLIDQLVQFEIKVIFKKSDDIMAMMLLENALRIKFGQSSDRQGNHLKIDLDCPYIPYGRQDRACSSGDPFSLKVMASIINSCDFSTVYTIDCHSTVTNALINNLHEFKFYECESFRKNIEPLVNNGVMVVSPDQGSYKKLTNYFGSEKIVSCSKVRCLQTGKITNTVIYDTIEKGKDYIIVDDICDGGATFIAIAKQLKEKGANKVYLYVTHGIFSKGIDVLKEYIDEVFCGYQF